MDAHTCSWPRSRGPAATRGLDRPAASSSPVAASTGQWPGTSRRAATAAATLGPGGGGKGRAHLWARPRPEAVKARGCCPRCGGGARAGGCGGRHRLSGQNGVSVRTAGTGAAEGIGEATGTGTPGRGRPGVPRLPQGRGGSRCPPPPPPRVWSSGLALHWGIRG